MKKWIFLLRAFFPSWKFFDQVGSRILLEVRTIESERDWSGWVPVLPPISRGLGNLFFNPQGNVLHAAHTLVQNLSFEVLTQDETRPETTLNLTNYKLVKNLVEFHLRATQLSSFSKNYQFRVLVNGECLLISPTYRLDSKAEEVNDGL